VRAEDRDGLGAGGFALLAALSALSPLTSTFILPALPGLAVDLAASLPAAQLAMSAGFGGLAVGLLVVGPMSDRFGRRRPLSIGLVAYVLTTVLCAIAPDVATLVLFRLLQGVAGGAIWVITRAVVRDAYGGSGSSGAKVFSQLAMVTGIAPVLAPFLAGQLLLFTDWRGLLAVLAVVGALVGLLAVAFMQETLPPHRRQTQGIRAQAKAFASILRAPYFRGVLALAVVQSAMYFTFVMTSPFVFEGQFGMSPQAFGVFFAGSALTIALGNQVNVLMLRRWPSAGALHILLLIAVVGAVGFLIAAVVGAPLPVVIAVLLLVPFAAGASNANITALGLAPYAASAGSAAAVLGASQFGMAVVVPPLVSLFGVRASTMGAALVITALGAWFIGLALRSRIDRQAWG